MLPYVLFKSLYVHQVNIDQQFEGLVLAKDLPVRALPLEQFVVLVDISTQQDGALCCHCVLGIVLYENLYHTVSQVVQQTHSIFRVVFVVKEDRDERFQEVHHLDASLCKVLFFICSFLDVIIALLLVLAKYFTHLFDDIVDNFLIEYLDLIADIVNHIDFERL